MDDIQDKPLKIVREQAKAMPNARLIPITTVLLAFSDMPDARASISETADALWECYDRVNLMMYVRLSDGLACAIDGNLIDESSGIEERGEVINHFYNSRYWNNKNAVFHIKGGEFNSNEILMDRKDTNKLGYALWEFFWPDYSFDVDEFSENITALSQAQRQAEAADRSKGQDEQGEAPAYLDASHPRYSTKLAAVVNAWLAFEAIPGKTVRQSMERWLRANAGQYGLIKEDGTPNESAIVELSKVANWDTNGGPPKTPG